MFGRRNEMGALEETAEQLESEIDEAMLTLQLALVRIESAARA